MAVVPSDDVDNAGSYNRQYLQKKRPQGMAPRVGKPENVKENGYNRHDQKVRSFLDPISGGADDNISSYNPSVAFKPDENESLLPGKAALARGSVTRKKVPPIPLSSESFDSSDSAYTPSEEGKTSMNGSLKSIRNSATKKRADKLFEKLEKQSVQQSINVSPVNNDPLDESGIFTASSHSDQNKKSYVKKPDQKISYETSTNNLHGRRTTAATETVDSVKKGAITHIDYNPTSGVTFRENHNSDVQVVGKGYVEDTSDMPLKVSPSVAVSRLKERKRLNSKGPLVTHAPLGLASMHLPGCIDLDTDDKTTLHKSRISLVGKGLFDTSSSVDAITAVDQSPDTRLKLRKNDFKAAPTGVVGVAVRSTVDLSNLSPDTSAGDEEWEDENISMTQSLKEKVAVRQQQRLEEDERRRAEKERKEREKEEKRERDREEKLKKERERQQEKLKRLSSAESINALDFLSVSGSASGSASSNNISTTPTASSTTLVVKPVSPKLTPPVVTPRKTLKLNNEPVLSFPMSAESGSTDMENPDDWKPFKDSDVALRDILKKLEQDDWETKCEGINMLRRLSMHHPDTVLASLHQIVLAITNEAQNLRSQVSRLAMKAIGDMFLHLKRQMDPEVELTAKILLAKGGESNQFIREDADKALCSMLEHVTPQRALMGLIVGGASHKNANVRKMTAQLLVDLVEKMGSGRILSGVKDITDKVLPTASQFTVDSSQETRYYGRKIFYMLMAHQDFDRMLSKYVPANSLRNVQDIVDNLRQKGLGEHPSEISSARSRRSGHGSRSSSAVREGSASSSADSGIGNQPLKRRTLVRTNDAHMEEVMIMIGLLSANNWQQRYEGISNFLSMCEMNPMLVSTHIIKIFDKFLPRLQDSNSKVNMYALKVMLQVTPILKDHLSNVISMTVAAVAPNLSSKNREINSTAAEILEAFIENLDLALLVQPFASQAINATSRSKADLVLKVAYLVERVYPRKQKQVVLHVLPLLWHLLGSMNTSGAAVHGGNGDLRQAISLLASKLHDFMGQSLLEKASAEPSNTQRHLQMLQSLLDGS
ncbi:hypothetical protein BsWGS_15464 [Bradybaena similaris]